MEFIGSLIDTFLHLDRSLGAAIAAYGLWVYPLLFAIIFTETGLVVMPFLPGDSLLFAAGAFAAAGSLNPFVLVAILGLAAILGDTANYWIGKRIGKGVLKRGTLLGIRIKTEHLERTERFYERYGGKTIVLARFLPFVRTFAPFVAGVGRMRYGTFIFYNVIGGLTWVTFFVLAGYLFGNLPAVKERFSLVIIAIIAVSLLPTVIEHFRSRRRRVAK